MPLALFLSLEAATENARIIDIMLQHPVYPEGPSLVYV